MFTEDSLGFITDIVAVKFVEFVRHTARPGSNQTLQHTDRF